MKRRLDEILFNGYVREPIPMVIFPVIVAIAALFLAVSATADTIRPTPPTSSAEAEEVFAGYEYAGPIFVLSAANGQEYDLPKNAIADDGLLERLTKDSAPVLVEYEVEADADETSRRDILSVSATDGTCLVSRSATAQARLKNTHRSLLFLWGFCILYLAFIISIYYFVSHAPKYPRIAALLVKKSNRNF